MCLISRLGNLESKSPTTFTWQNHRTHRKLGLKNERLILGGWESVSHCLECQFCPHWNYDISSIPSSSYSSSSHDNRALPRLLTKNISLITHFSSSLSSPFTIQQQQPSPMMIMTMSRSPMMIFNLLLPLTMMILIIIIIIFKWINIIIIWII